VLVLVAIENKLSYAMKKESVKHLTDLSQVQVVSLAVYLCGGGQKAIDTEDVAMKAHQIAPGRFSWTKYADQVNLELVRVYLSAAKNPNNGQMLSGSGKSGWTLTQTGLDFAKRAEKRMASLGLSRKRQESRSGSIDENRWRRERTRIISSSVWNKWTEGIREFSIPDAHEIYRIDHYAIGGLRDKKITRLRSLFLNDGEIDAFLEHLAKVVTTGDLG